jgi:hypothetical protein
MRASSAPGFMVEACIVFTWPSSRSADNQAPIVLHAVSFLSPRPHIWSPTAQIPPPALVSASVSSRAKFLLCMCLIDMVAVCFLALASYNWSLDALLHQDVQKCSIRASLIDIACLSIARSASFVALMNLPTRLMVRGSAGKGQCNDCGQTCAWKMQGPYLRFDSSSLLLQILSHPVA